MSNQPYYPKQYTGPKPIEEQVKLLANKFGLNPKVDFEFFDELPEGSEGLFAIPRWQRVAPSYYEATQKAIKILKQSDRYTFYDMWVGNRTEDNFRLTKESTLAFEQIATQQQDLDILVVPAQFGSRHRKLSVSNTLYYISQNNEVGLGAFEGFCMLLAHPERCGVDNENINTGFNCPGDEFNPFGYGEFFVDSSTVLVMANECSFHRHSKSFPVHDCFGSISMFITNKAL